MLYSKHIATIAELSESEGVFTTAQAKRMGIPRDALHDAVESGRLMRVMHGAYRMVGSGTSVTDDLAAIWKLTSPAKFSYERMRTADWDGIAIGGSTASALLDIGDLELEPYRFFAPRRINSRNLMVRFSKRAIARIEVTFESGFPVTRPERTIFDLVKDCEDFSLVADVLSDAVRKFSNFDFVKLKGLFAAGFGESRGQKLFENLLGESELLGRIKNEI